MQAQAIRELDVVALTEDMPKLGLFRGTVGTVVCILSPTDFEVEFVDQDGGTFALATLNESSLLLLRFNESATAA